MDLGLTGKAALVTGGSRGIGLATAHRLATEGAAVSICARGKVGLDAAVGQLRAAGATAVGAVADVTVPAHVERFVADTVRGIGRLDVVVANAGGSVGGRLLDSTPEDWARTFGLNVLHAATVIRAAVPHLRQDGGGSVVIVSSISGWRAAPTAQYAAAKAAETHLAASLARELAKDRIRVNAVSPGTVSVDPAAWKSGRAMQREMEEFVERELPAGRLGTPEEIADVICFLASPRAQWVNGTDVRVDGAQGRPSPGGW